MLELSLNRKFGNFTLLFHKGRHGIVLRCVWHVQHACFSLFQSKFSLICDVVVAVNVVYANVLFATSLEKITQSKFPCCFHLKISTNARKTPPFASLLVPTQMARTFAAVPLVICYGQTGELAQVNKKRFIL